MTWQLTHPSNLGYWFLADCSGCTILSCYKFTKHDGEWDRDCAVLYCLALFLCKYDITINAQIPHICRHMTCTIYISTPHLLIAKTSEQHSFYDHLLFSATLEYIVWFKHVSVVRHQSILVMIYYMCTLYAKPMISRFTSSSLHTSFLKRLGHNVFWASERQQPSINTLSKTYKKQNIKNMHYQWS